MKRSLLSAVGIALALLSTGCLETRSSQKEIEEKQVLRKQVQNLAATSADVNQRFQDTDDQLRRFEGRVENVERRVEQSQSQSQNGAKAVETKVVENDKAYREEFAGLKSEIEKLNQKIAQLQEEMSRKAAAPVSSGGSKNAFEDAESKFSSKNWKEAILDYQNYRNANPKGKQFSTATYKIGVAFQELGMVDEARAFYEEVIAKFPKSKDAKSASTKLKSLKK